MAKGKLRCGYTTGTCAAIAAKAAVKTLLEKNDVIREQIITPNKTKVSVEIDRLVILAKTIAKPVTLPVITSLGIKKKYMAILMINIASVIVKKLFNVFVFICKTSTFYYAKKSVKKEEYYLFFASVLLNLSLRFVD